jgi:hypothetical protein
MSDHTWDEVVNPGFVSLRWSLERFQDELTWLENHEGSECGEFGRAAGAIGKMMDVLIHIEARTFELRDADETQNPDFEWSAAKPAEGGE